MVSVVEYATPTDVVQASDNELYRRQVEAKICGLDGYDPIELERLRAALGISELEADQHERNCHDLTTVLESWAEVDRAKAAIPAALAAREKVREKWSLVVAFTTVHQMRERDDDFARADAEIARLRNIVANGNAFYWMLDKLVDPSFGAELNEIGLTLERLREKKDELRRKAKPDIRVHTVRDENHEGQRVVRLGIKHWEREAKFAETDAERSAARKRALELSAAARQLTEVNKQIVELEEVLRELEVRRPTPRDFAM